MIVILFAEVRVTKISATTFVNGFSTLFFRNIKFVVYFSAAKLLLISEYFYPSQQKYVPSQPKI